LSIGGRPHLGHRGVDLALGDVIGVEAEPAARLLLAVLSEPFSRSRRGVLLCRER
jgi:hypothetical protein